MPESTKMGMADMVFVGYSGAEGTSDFNPNPPDGVDRCPHGVWGGDHCYECEKLATAAEPSRIRELEDLVRKAYRTMIYYHRGPYGPSPDLDEEQLDEWFATAARLQVTDFRKT